MRFFLISCDFDLWQFILDGHMDHNSESHAWDGKTKTVHAVNTKAMNALFCFFSETKYTKGFKVFHVSRFDNF